MEEIREVALAYYNNLSEDEKRQAYQAFRELDSNSDGTITIDELLETSDNAQACRTRSLFRELDTNGDGKLDFDEFVTLFYLDKSHRDVGCYGIGCKVFIKGVYFTCVECFNHNKTTTYDLCVSCYRYKNYVHAHNTFLDSHFLFRSMAECRRTQNQPIPPKPSQVEISGSKTPIPHEPSQIDISGSKTLIPPEPSQIDISKTDAALEIIYGINNGQAVVVEGLNVGMKIIDGINNGQAVEGLNVGVEIIDGINNGQAVLVEGLDVAINIGQAVVSVASTGCSIM